MSGLGAVMVKKKLEFSRQTWYSIRNEAKGHS